VIVLCAPSGYGKSVLLRQWIEQDPRPAFTILLGPHHNDPTVLVEAIVESLQTLEPFPESLADALLAPIPDITNTVAPRLVAAMESRTKPFILALDELERITAPDALEIVAALCRGMPPGAQLALASRTEPQVGLGRLRVRRMLTELGIGELTMTRGECAALLATIGLELSPRQLDAIARRTEGWPAALYLAGLALSESTDPGRAVARFTGDDRIVVDYLREEFLLPASGNRAAFLRQAALLEGLSGPLCDFALGRDDSGIVLDEMRRSNMLLVPLDRRGEWYRLHPLLQEMLRAELHRTESAAAPAIHRRASEWWSAAGDPDQAIHHAIAAGDEQLAGRLLFAAVPEYSTRGRNATLIGWLDLLGERGVAASPGASLTAAWAEMTLGDGPRAERWIAVTRRLLDAEAPDADPAMEGGLALAEATLARQGLEAMRATVVAVEPLIPEDDPWRTLTAELDGIGLHLLGEREAARARLKEAVRRGSVGAPDLQVISLSQLALIAIERGDWQLADEKMSRARAQIERTGLAEYPVLALAYAASALIRAHQGAVADAGVDLETGRRHLGALVHYSSWYEIEIKVTLARASARLGRRAEAERLLGSAAAQLAEIPEDSLLTEWVAIARAELGAHGSAAEVELTPAELRVLQFLPQHLSFPQIAAGIQLSPNTVKTHAGSIYRKLGCSSRDQAVRRAREVGLLEDH
jgi:LuxR family maltose regulon positive regulatory protein